MEFFNAGETFEQIHKEKKESLVLISHQERIIEMADRIMVIADGKVQSIGAAQEMIPKLFGEKSRHVYAESRKGRTLWS